MLIFNLIDYVFDDVIYDDEGQAVIPDNWVLIDNQEQIDHISLTITNGGKVYLEGEVLHITGPAPSTIHQWDTQTSDWVIDMSHRQLLQTQIWESIKTKRHTITRGGVYLPSVDKWFHSDDASRTQYLAMQIMPQLPPNLMWKTMDGSFIAMTKELLNEIALTMMTQEQSDFANAERHRTAMMAVDNPLEYDYSDGWSEVYGE